MLLIIFYLNNFAGRCGSNETGHIPAGTVNRPAMAGAGSAGPLRGRKRDVWEGGHRVPGIVSWPAVVAPGNNAASPKSTDNFDNPNKFNL